MVVISPCFGKGPCGGGDASKLSDFCKGNMATLSQTLLVVTIVALQTTAIMLMAHRTSVQLSSHIERVSSRGKLCMVPVRC